MQPTSVSTNSTSGDSSPKVLLITNQLQLSLQGGRELLCKLHYNSLKDIYGKNLVFYELPQTKLQGATVVLKAFAGHIDGLNDSTISKALQIIQSVNISKIFIDGSNLGAFVKMAKQRFAQVEISTFFHNVEAKFFLGSLKQNKTPHALAVLMVNYLAERKSVRYSDKIICLNERDSKLLQRLYGRSATHLSPMALQDQLPPRTASPVNPEREKFALFVGGTFYANRSGISWFVKYVAPHISIKTCIIGRGFEKLRNELEIKGKVEVIGEVDNLAQWYQDAHFVIAPIFDGSGMKTKVAEALMFGKKIIGTPEAFSGYEEITERAGATCTTADEFISAINAADSMVNSPFDNELRAIYEAKYSYEAKKTSLENILNAAIN